MAASLKELLQSFTVKIAEKIKELQGQINDFQGGGTLSPNEGNNLVVDEEGGFYFKQRTPEEIAAAYEGLTNTNKYTDADKATLASIVEGLVLKADLDPETGKVRLNQLPDLTITNAVVANENTLEAFLLNSSDPGYDYVEGDAIIILSAPDINDDVFTSHYLFLGGDRDLEANYSKFNAERVDWANIIGKPGNLETIEGSQAKADQAEANAKAYAESLGSGTASPTEIISFSTNYQSGLTFNPAASFKESGVVKSDSRSITADPADATFDRFDLWAIDLTLDQIILIKGVASANPVTPDYDPLTQLPANIISIKAGAVTPENVVGVAVYSEGNEWLSTGAGADFDLQNPESPASGTYAIKAINPLINSQSLPFIAPVPKAWEEGMEIVYKIKNITGGVYRWLVQGTKANGRDGSIFINAPFNYSVSSLVYQPLSVVIPSGIVNITRISLISGVDGFQYFLDDVKLVTGGGVITGNYATMEQVEIARLSAIAEANAYTDQNSGGGTGSGLTEVYQTISAMIADQNAQFELDQFRVNDASEDPTVTSGRANYEYLGTTTGTLADYYKYSEEESMDLDNDYEARITANEAAVGDHETRITTLESAGPGDGSGTSHIAAGPFTGVVDASLYEGRVVTRYYDDYTSGAVVNLSLSATKALGATATVRIKGDLTGTIPADWNYSGQPKTSNTTKFNELNLLYVKEDDVRIVNRIVNSNAPLVEPSSLTNLQLWYDGTDSSTMTLNTGKVEVLDDKADANTLGFSLVAPAFNTDRIEFRQTGTLYGAPEPVLKPSGNFHGFFIFRMMGTVGNDYVMNRIDANNRFAIGYKTGHITVGTYNGSAFNAKSIAFTDQTSFHKLEFKNINGVITGILDGVTMTGTNAPSTNAQPNFILGGSTYNGASTTMTYYDHKDLFIKEGEMTTQERNDMLNYIASKYGL